MASNIIQLAFNGETSATSDELVYKYDYGQKLEFTDLELPEVFEVHFAQQRLGRAVKQIGQNNIVDIPDGLLEKGSVYGWIFLHETASDGETEYEFKIPVKNRAMPTDGEITPEQESVISQTIAVLVEAKDAALDAQEAAETAQGLAESAQSGAVTAQGLAEDAQEAAETAQGLAEAAQTAAESAQTASETAQGLAEDARDDAVAAKDLVLGMSATAVTLDPDEPATADYEDGLLTLGIPQGIQGVQGDTGNGIASAVLNADYTLTLTFTNGTTYTTPSIRGEQGIQGDTGVGISSVSKTSTSGLVDTYTVTLTNGQTTTFTVTNGQTGATPNISIGTVTTLDPDESATATISGTAENPVLSFGIPKGDTGEVTQAEFDEAVTDLKSDLNNLYQPLDLNLIANSYWTVSGSPIGTPVAYNGWSRTDRLPCKAGEIIKITSTVQSAYNIFFNTDTDGDINQAFTVRVGDNEFKVPEGAHYYALSNTTSGMQNTTVSQMIDVDNIASKAEVSEFEGKIDNALETTNIYKDIDFSSAVEGYFISNTGVYSENSAFCLLSGVNLTKGQTIHIKLRGTTTVATLAKSLGNNQYEPLLIGQGGSAVSDQEYIATEDMTVAISYSKTYDHSGYIFFDVSNIADASGKVFYCTPTSGFYSALEAIRADDSLGIRTLYVQAGEYDLYDELGGNDYANSCIPDESYVPPNTAWKHFSVVCPDRLKIVGLGDVVLKMNIPANTWAEGAIPNSVLAPLSMRYGCEVENIKVECANTRYGIHIEGSGEASYRKVQYVFRNVTVEYTITDDGYVSAIGCGLNADDNLILDNCVLKIIGAYGNGIAGHLNDGSSNVFVNNSFINAPTTDFDVKWNTKGKDSRFRFLNTILNKITMSNGNLGQTPYTIIYEMVRTDATMKRPSDTSITMPTIVNYGSNLTIDEWV